jgi:hypothetical protein
MARSGDAFLHNALLFFAPSASVPVFQIGKGAFMQRWSFTEHPGSVGESYGEHFVSASKFSISMIFGGIACLIHGLFPFVFVSTGSATIRALYERMIAKRQRVEP